MATTVESACPVDPEEEPPSCDLSGGDCGVRNGLCNNPEGVPTEPSSRRIFVATVRVPLTAGEPYGVFFIIRHEANAFEV
jgi:hypothetical protein